MSNDDKHDEDIHERLLKEIGKHISTRWAMTTSPGLPMGHNEQLLRDACEEIGRLKAALSALPSVVPQGYKLLKDTTFAERSYPEHLSHENGSYHCTCCECGRTFQGHKRTVICKVCVTTPPSHVAPQEKTRCLQCGAYVTPSAAPNEDVVLVPKLAWEGFVSLLNVRLGKPTNRDKTPAELVEMARAAISASSIEPPRTEFNICKQCGADLVPINATAAGASGRSEHSGSEKVDKPASGAPRLKIFDQRLRGHLGATVDGGIDDADRENNAAPQVITAEASSPVLGEVGKVQQSEGTHTHPVPTREAETACGAAPISTIKRWRKSWAEGSTPIPGADFQDLVALCDLALAQLSSTAAPEAKTLTDLAERLEFIANGPKAVISEEIEEACDLSAAAMRLCATALSATGEKKDG